MKLLRYICFLLFLSCGTHKNELPEDSKSLVESSKLIVLQDSLSLKKPTTVFLKNSPKPSIISVPDQKGSISAFQTFNEKCKFPQNKNIQWTGFFKTYFTDDGLAMDAVWSICVDKRGNVWFGSDGGGLSRFDGKSFTNFTIENGLENMIIRSVLEDKLGNIWVGTYGGGLSCFNGKSFKTYKTQQGLCNNNVLSVIEDHKGRLWIGTQGGGIACFDPSLGQEACIKATCDHNFKDSKELNLHNKEISKCFSNYTLPGGEISNNIICLLEDKDHLIWCGTPGNGVYRFDANTPSSRQPDFIHYNTENGLGNNNIKDIFQDRSARIWFATDGAGVSCLGTSDVNHECYLSTCEHNLKIEKDKIQHDATLAKAFSNYTTKHGLPSDFIKSIQEDNRGNIWFATKESGVSCYNGEYATQGRLSFLNYSSENGLANNVVWTMAKDLEGNIWFGTDGGGVSRFNGPAFVNYTHLDGQPFNSTRSILEDEKGDLWIASYYIGLTKFKCDSLSNLLYDHSYYATKHGLVNSSVLSVKKERSGAFWFTTYGSGVTNIKGNISKTYTTQNGLANNLVWCMDEDKNARMWFGTGGGGLSCFDGNTFTNYGKEQGLSNLNIRSILVDSHGNVWSGSVGGGLYRFDGKSFTNYSTENGLPDDKIWCIVEDKVGNIWLGTGGGISRFDGKTFLTLKKENGLPDNMVTQMLFDNDGNLIVGTNFGIAVISGFSSMNADQKIILPQNRSANTSLVNYYPEIKVYNSANGYPVKDVNIGQNSMYKDRKGIIWIGTGANKTGLVRFDPKQISTEIKKPNVFIYDLKIRNEQVCWNDLLSEKLNADAARNRRSYNKDYGAIVNEEMNTFGRVLKEEERIALRSKYQDIKFSGTSNFSSVPTNLVLPYKFNSVTFVCVAIEPSQSDALKFQYFLEGYDKTWSPPSKASTVSYGNIYEGEYTFHLRAQNAGGAWSLPTTYKFRVLPPVWRTGWMYGVYVIILIGLIFLYNRINTKLLKEKAQKLNEKITLATQEIVKQKEEVDNQRDLATNRLRIAEKQQKVILDSVEEMKLIQKKLEEAKSEAERANRAKSEFLSNMSHEIRTPLNAVLGFSELLKGLKLEQKQESYVNGILTGGKNLLNIINDILDLSKIEAGQMNINYSPVNLKALVNEFVQLYTSKAEESKINFVVELFDHGLPMHLMIDETRIRQVLFNLLGNAFKFTSKGEIRLAVDLQMTNEDASKLIVTFSVSDTGIGIPEDQQNNIFEAFKQQDGQSTRKYGGTGLGLTITKRLVDLMNGKILLNSTQGVGSTFSIVIPEVSVSSMEMQDESEQFNEECRFLGQTILLVEDIESNREIVKGFLERLNIKVICAENGKVAIDNLDAIEPDLIIMDIMMPVMDGLTATKIIKASPLHKQIPIVVVTASAMRFNEDDITNYCDDYMNKPINKKELIKGLMKFLEHESVKSVS